MRLRMEKVYRKEIVGVSGSKREKLGKRGGRESLMKE